MQLNSITPEFVEFIPSNLKEGVLYISQKYGTAAHKCCCGCGIKIVTPITPTDWRLTISGNTVTLAPSIGNWNHPCQSHYWIKGNLVIWAGSMTQQQIKRGRDRDRTFKKIYYEKLNNTEPVIHTTEIPVNNAQDLSKIGIWSMFKIWIKSMFN